MPREIERKFLVSGDGWRAAATGSERIRQCYLAATERAQIRIRIIDGEGAVLTVKSAALERARDEFEYAIPMEDAEALMALCTGRCIDKRRHLVPLGEGHECEVDEFQGDHAGLTVAEIELASEEERFARPEWLGEEVTGDRRYYNSELAGV